jgi:hypothetical protein
LAAQRPEHPRVGGTPLDLEVIGVAPDTRYGGLKGSAPPVVYVPYPQMPVRQLQQMMFALRTDGDPLPLLSTVRAIVRDADARAGDERRD